ncbi:glycosyltransferase [Amnibacterium endophyticum]|uniref:Glycosyltransferase n=1 Tax=Amnibacterium endophyticum TaxID=2109337 RepID=A0ABW4LFP9_9MICO
MRELRVGVLRHTVYLPSERFIPDQVRALERCSPIVLARDSVIDPVPGIRTRQLPLHSTPARAAYITGVAANRSLQSVIADERLELLHAHFGVEGLYSRRAAERAGIPHVVTLHGFDVSYSREALLRARTPSWARYALLREGLLRSPSLFVCVSEHVRRLAIGLGASEERTPVITTGVDTTLLLPTPVPDEPRVVHVARLVEKKGTEYLVEAVRRARLKVPDLRLDVIGDGPLLGRLTSQVSEAGLKEAVTFHGALPHALVLELMRRAAVVAVPSVTARSGDTEGLPQAVLEAGALGRPVVGTRHAGIGEAVTDDTGVLVGERDAGSLADALVQVLGSHVVAADMGARGRDRIVEHFDLQRQARRLRDAYEAEVAAGAG